MSRRRDERGVAFPSPLVMLSIIAIAMAGIAFVATKDRPAEERRVETVSRAEEPAVDPTVTEPPAPEVPEVTPTVEPEPVIERGKVYVEVYNNSGIRGLAASTAAKVSGAGWQVVGSDNWYGTVPGTTVYFPKRLKAEAELLALDLGVQRVQPAVSPMKLDRLTVILTG
ncbi:LytR C-terminal domain-containing protein [Nocardioides houyundeii]|uniref:LytR C-terminal domain-containing protein n=1 Tax=Nocardioides houyundeii TaxID=2045452 RepID=UPI000DF357B1|nr:LytR C-terminal domain-containing protein [Nocardioides houyundeii]